MVCGSQKSSRSRNAIGRSIAPTATSSSPAARNKSAIGSGSQVWKCGRGSRLAAAASVTATASQKYCALHLAVLVPDVGADRTAGTGSAHHLGDRGGWIRHEVEDEPSDHRVIGVARHRDGAGVANLETGARIGD